MPISTIGSNSLNQTSDLTINGQTVGKGGGNVATNTVHGVSALSTNSTGSNQTVFGYQSGQNISAGSDNDGFGYQSLQGASSSSATYNAGFGWKTLAVVSSATQNSAFGRASMSATTTGSSNAGFGSGTLENNTTGSFNTAVGRQALVANTTASFNTAVGYQALDANTTGTENVAIGVGALGGNTTGGENIAIGRGAGESIVSGIRNTLIGDDCCYLITGNSNTVIGRFTGNSGGLDIRTSDNYIVLSDGSGNPRLWSNGSGYIFVPGVYAATTGGGANVVVGSSGQLERSTSSLKYKRDVQDAVHGLAKVLQLRPVTYKGKGENDGETVFGGLIAEEVHAAGLTEFVQYAKDGSPDALTYSNMVSLCIKAIQELKTIVDAQAAEIAELKAKVA